MAFDRVVSASLFVTVIPLVDRLPGFRFVIELSPFSIESLKRLRALSTLLVLAEFA